MSFITNKEESDESEDQRSYSEAFSSDNDSSSLGEDISVSQDFTENYLIKT